jgi:hypothetical protein
MSTFQRYIFIVQFHNHDATLCTFQVINLFNHLLHVNFFKHHYLYNSSNLLLLCMTIINHPNFILFFHALNFFEMDTTLQSCKNHFEFIKL